jgi:dTDP-4-amino-4,6-dideoxygalactose transaminase
VVRLVEKLAIEGGERTIPEGLIKPWPIITDEDKKAVLDVLSSGQDLTGAGMGGGVLWGLGPQMLALEKEWAQYIGSKHCIVTNSGTAALHIAVAAAGVGPGDEVITSAFTFLASASCVLHHNGVPVFVDINPKTLTIYPEKIEEKITKRTRAIVPVHIHGLPAEMDEINRIARKYDLVVIEDCCQAHGAEYRGRKVGSLGDMAAFSLNGSKNLQAGEGGLFNTDREDYRELASKVRSFGEAIKRGEPRKYNATIMGWQYRPHELTCALARSQLKHLDEWNDVRIKNCEYLTDQLSKIDGIQPPYVPPYMKSVYWAYVVRFRPADLDIKLHPRKFRLAIERALNAEGVPVGQWQTMPVPAQSIFQFQVGYGKGCPWTCPFGDRPSEYVYRGEDYPETVKLIDDSTRIQGVWPPNDVELMGLCAEATRKVFDNLGPVTELARRLP